MADARITYGASTDITCDVHTTPLPDGSLWQSAAIDNGTFRFIDAQVGGYVTTGSSPTDKKITIYAYGSADDATTYSGDASGSNEAYSGNEDNLRLLGVVYGDGSTSNEKIEFGPFSVASVFGGYLPEDWGIVVKNDTGVALNSTAGNHDFHYQGIKVNDGT